MGWISFYNLFHRWAVRKCEEDISKRFDKIKGIRKNYGDLEINRIPIYQTYHLNRRLYMLEKEIYIKSLIEDIDNFKEYISKNDCSSELDLEEIREKLDGFLEEKF